MKQSNKVFHMTVISMFLAILIIQTFVPVLGYIPLGAIDITIVHITVILAAILFGPKTGTIIVASWGLLSMTRSYVQPSITNVFFQNPLISVLPRLLVGLLSALLFLFIRKKLSDRWAYSITALIGTLLNTVLVLGSIYLFAVEAYANATGIPESAVLGALGTVVVTNGLIEAVASMVILPLLAIPLAKVLKSRNISY